MNNLSICGGGAWGSALAYAFANKGEVSITSRRKLDLESIKTPYKIKQVESNIALESKFIVIAISTAHLRFWLESNKQFLDSNKGFLFVCKGIEESSGAFVHEIAQDFIPLNNICCLSGPSFATEVRKGLPCALAIHSNNQELAKQFALFFPHFIKPYVKNDLIGAEIAGAYKNVIAIAGGVSDSLKLGNNAKASLLARGLVEMERLSAFFGGKTETILGLEGAGDLFLSANSVLSRNYRVGFGLGENKKLESILKELGEVAEGVRTAYAIHKLATKHNIYTPIVNEVVAILDGKSCIESMNKLMGR